MNNFTQFPYEGTWEELQEIRSEIACNQAARDRLSEEMVILQRHQRYVLSLIRAKM